MLRYSKCPIDQSENGYIENKYVYDEGTIICYFSEKVRHMTSKCRHVRFFFFTLKILIKSDFLVDLNFKL